VRLHQLLGILLNLTVYPRGASGSLLTVAPRLEIAHSVPTMALVGAITVGYLARASLGLRRRRPRQREWGGGKLGMEKDWLT